MSKVVIPLILSSILVLFVIAILAPAAVAAPNENANDQAHEQAKFVIPENAVQIAPGFYSLGKYEVDGTMIEGFLVLHHRPNHEGGNPGGGEDPPPPDPEESCFSFLAENIGWKRPEPWLVNPANIGGLGEAGIFPILSGSITDWEDVAGKNILGNGQETTEMLSLDWTFPTDGVNEVYFVDIDFDGAIAGTGVWIRTPPSGDTIIFEWDQIYDDVDFDWSNNAGNATAGTMDFKNIAMHELGHAMGMGHPQPQDSETCIDETMYWRTAVGETKKRDLNSGDIAGIQQLN